MNDDLKKEIRKLSLQNAIEHDGNTKDKIILAKILGTIPELKKMSMKSFLKLPQLFLK